MFSDMVIVHNSCHNHRVSELGRILKSDGLSSSSEAASTNLSHDSCLPDFLVPHLHSGGSI